VTHRRVSLTPHVDDLHRRPFRLGRQLVTEEADEKTVHDRVQPFLNEAIALLLGLPDVDVAQPALGPLDGEVDDESLRRFVAKAIGDLLVEGGIDGQFCVNAYVINSPFAPNSIRMEVWPLWPSQSRAAATTMPPVKHSRRRPGSTSSTPR
jgi:hypothetical protein